MANFIGNHGSQNRSGEPLWTGIELITVFGLFFALVYFIAWRFETGSLTQQLMLWAVNIILMFMVWGSQYLRGESLASLGLTFSYRSWRSLLKRFLWSLLLFILALVAFMSGTWIMTSIGYNSPATVSANYDYLFQNPFVFIISLLGVYLVSSVGEELVYRGYLMCRIRSLFRKKRAGNAIAVLGSTLVFGLIHYGWGITGMVQTAFMGLVFAIGYLCFNRKLFVLILAHAYMDTLLFLNLYFS